MEGCDKKSGESLKKIENIKGSLPLLLIGK